MFGSEPVPFHSFGTVLRDALAEVVLNTEVELSLGITLVGSQPEPFHGFGIVLRDAFACGVHDPEIELCVGITLFRSLPDRVEIVLCREPHDGEATHHDHGSSYADQPWYFIYRLQM